MRKLYDAVVALFTPDLINKFKPLEYFKKFFDNYADYTGRSNQAEFWWPVAFNFVIMLALNILMSLFEGRISILYQLVSVVQFLYTLLCLIPSITIGIRRLHDIKQSGWWLLLGLAPAILVFIPVIGSILTLLAVVGLIILLALPTVH